jgi:hypothetical protein
VNGLSKINCRLGKETITSIGDTIFYRETDHNKKWRQDIIIVKGDSPT